MICRSVGLVLLLFASNLLATLQAQPSAAPTKKKRAKNPAFNTVTDNPDLPRVLLIGDSISIGYTVPTQKALADVANVHRPPTNCGPTSKGVAAIGDWLGDNKTWDVIHFNWGLHDLKYINADNKLAEPNSEGSSQQIPPEQYEANLRELVAKLKKTGATLIWRNTTPVPSGAKGRIPDDAAKYNEIAAKIMKEHGIPIHDMFAFCNQHPEMQQQANVHFTPEGSQQLAETVAEQIKSALAKP